MLLISCALLLAALVPVAAQAYEGEKIYAKKLKKSVSEISVVDYGQGGADVIDTWNEGILGRQTGEWLYCTEPHVRFREGYKTGVPAEEHMSEESIQLIGALMYWYDEHMCGGTDSTDEYLFRQEIVWNILNLEKKWRPDCRYEHGLGEKCGSGHSLESHRENLFSEGLDWAEENSEYVETEATVYEGDGQPLMDLTYKWSPEGTLKICKLSAEPDLTDGNGCYSLDGAEYRVYSDEKCTDMICKFTTDKTGKTGEKVIAAGEYYVREYKAPAGYALDRNIYPVTVEKGGEETLNLYDAPQMNPVDILVRKTDADTGKNEPSGAADLKGAQFTVCYYPGLYDSAPSGQPERTWVFGTDEEGVCRLDESSLISGDPLYTDSEGKAALPLGTVTIRETKAPEGYQINTGTFIRQITADGTSEHISTYVRVDVPEEIIRGELQIVKVGQDADGKAGDKKPLEGAVFEITSKTTGESFRIKTDKEGYASSGQAGGLPFDTYVVSEVVTPAGYEPVEDFEITVREEGQILHYILEDKLITAPVQLVKLASDTGKVIPVAGARFQLLDSGKKPVEMTAGDSKEESVSIFTTDEAGSFVLPEKLPAGVYYFREVTAPAGYLAGGEDIRFEVTESSGWDEPVVVQAEDSPVKGRIRVQKTDDEGRKPVSGAVLEIIAKEDIITPDKEVRLKKGTVADTVTTDKNGKAESKDLFPGNYSVREKSAPEGYVLNTGTHDVELKYKDQDTAVVYGDVRITDEFVKGKIRITKADSETGKLIPVKAEFEITAAEDIVTPDGTVRVKKGTVVDTVVTGKDGKGSSKELFPGKYAVTEKNAPSGYLLNSQTFNVELAYKDQNTPVVYGDLTVADAPAMGKIRITKSDEYTEETLKDAVFSIIAAEDITTADGTVRAAKGTVVAEITSGEDGIAESKPLYPGKYIIREDKQPAGYIFPEQNEWPVELKYQDQNTAVVTVTEKIRNRPTVVIIDKKVTGSEQRLSGVKFVIWNKDKDDPVDPGMTYKEVYKTDRNGQIRIEAPEPGRYCVQEVDGVPGYSMDPDVHEFVIGEDGRIEEQEEYTLTVENRKTEIAETNALSVDTDSKETYPWKKTTVKDSVSLVNIQPGENYRLTGVLADPETGEMLREGGTPEGDLLTAELEFTGTDPEMTVDVTFEFDASPFAGRSLVVYEYLFQKDVLISEHTDPEDVKQQFCIAAPEMGTTAVSAETGTHEAETGETAVIRDKVEYKNIIPGDYVLKGILMDRESGKPLLINGEKITAEKEFKISETEGEIEVDFTLDASGLNGRSVVVFEYLYRKGCEEPAASHEDIRDKGQTVIFRDKIVPQTGDTSSVIPLLLLAAAGAGTAAILLFFRREKQRREKGNGCRHRKKKVIK